MVLKVPTRTGNGPMFGRDSASNYVDACPWNLVPFEIFRISPFGVGEHPIGASKGFMFSQVLSGCWVSMVLGVEEG